MRITSIDPYALEKVVKLVAECNKNIQPRDINRSRLLARLDYERSIACWDNDDLIGFVALSRRTIWDRRLRPLALLGGSWLNVHPAYSNSGTLHTLISTFLSRLKVDPYSPFFATFGARKGAYRKIQAHPATDDWTLRVHNPKIIKGASDAPTRICNVTPEALEIFYEATDWERPGCQLLSQDDLLSLTDPAWLTQATQPVLVTSRLDANPPSFAICQTDKDIQGNTWLRISYQHSGDPISYRSLWNRIASEWPRLPWLVLRTDHFDPLLNILHPDSSSTLYPREGLLLLVSRPSEAIKMLFPPHTIDRIKISPYPHLASHSSKFAYLTRGGLSSLIFGRRSWQQLEFLGEAHSCGSLQTDLRRHFPPTFRTPLAIWDF